MLGRISPDTKVISLIETNPIRKKAAPMMAINRFDMGPASETHMVAAGERRCSTYGLMGTGFAHPKPAIIIMSEPRGSRCARGLSVRRPLARGVLSPKRSATQACANSCTGKAVSKMIAYVISIGREGKKLSDKGVLLRQGLYHPVIIRLHVIMPSCCPIYGWMTSFVCANHTLAEAMNGK